MIKIAKNYRSICPAIFSDCLNCSNSQDLLHSEGQLKFKCKGRDLTSYIQVAKCSNQVMDQRVRRRKIDIMKNHSSSRQRSDSKTVYLSHSRSPRAHKSPNGHQCFSIPSTNQKSKEKIKLIKVRREERIVEKAIPEKDKRHNHVTRKTKLLVCAKMQQKNQEQSRLNKEISDLKVQLWKLFQEAKRLKVQKQTNVIFYEEMLLKLKMKENEIKELEALRKIEIARFRKDLQEVVQLLKKHH